MTELHAVLAHILPAACVAGLTPRVDPSPDRVGRGFFDLPAFEHRRLRVDLEQELARAQHVGRAVAGLLDHRVGHVQLVARARGCDVEQAPLLLDVGRLAHRGGHREAALGQPQHEADRPLEALRLVNCREHQHVVGLLGAEHVLRADALDQRQLAEELARGRVALGVAGELLEVVLARGRVGEVAVGVFAVVALDHAADHVAGVAERGVLEDRPQLGEAGQRPARAPAGQRGLLGQLLRARALAGGQQRRQLLGRLGADAGPQAQQADPAERVLGVLAGAQVGDDVLDVGLFEEAQAGADRERDLSPGELDLQLEAVAVVG